MGMLVFRARACSDHRRSVLLPLFRCRNLPGAVHFLSQARRRFLLRQRRQDQRPQAQEKLVARDRLEAHRRGDSQGHWTEDSAAGHLQKRASLCDLQRHLRPSSSSVQHGRS